jgi:hypothetical protein
MINTAQEPSLCYTPNSPFASSFLILNISLCTLFYNNRNSSYLQAMYTVAFYKHYNQRKITYLLAYTDIYIYIYITIFSVSGGRRNGSSWLKKKQLSHVKPILVLIWLQTSFLSDVSGCHAVRIPITFFGVVAPYNFTSGNRRFGDTYRNLKTDAVNSS